jgi:hypothetical protein
MSHQNATFKIAVSMMLTSDIGMSTFHAKLLELVLTEAGVG